MVAWHRNREFTLEGRLKFNITISKLIQKKSELIHAVTKLINFTVSDFGAKKLCSL